MVSRRESHWAIPKGLGKPEATVTGSDCFESGLVILLCRQNPDGEQVTKRQPYRRYKGEGIVENR